MPLEKSAYIFNHRAIGRLVNDPDTRGQAQLDVVVQTGSQILTGNRSVACQIGEDLPQDIQGLVHGPYTCIGSVITAAVVDHATGHSDLRKGVRPVNPDIWISFVVFEPHVVFRLVPLDQIHLENQGLELGIDDDPLYVRDARDQLHCLPIMGG